MATSVSDVLTLTVPRGAQVADGTLSAWTDRLSKLFVIALACILLIPVLLTFIFLALFVARLFGVPISGTEPPARPAKF
jgi:hypothetical protein